jgi:hypothetical protein
MLDISYTICIAMTEELRAKILKVTHLAPVKVLVAADVAVIKGMTGGGFQIGKNRVGPEKFLISYHRECSQTKV